MERSPLLQESLLPECEDHTPAEQLLFCFLEERSITTAPKKGTGSPKPQTAVLARIRPVAERQKVALADMCEEHPNPVGKNGAALTRVRNKAAPARVWIRD